MTGQPNQTPPVENTQPDGSPNAAAPEAGKNNNASAEPDAAKPAAQQPMELANREQEQGEIGAFKKFFLKIGEKVGTVKTTEFSEDYLAAVTEVDNYKVGVPYSEAVN